MQLKIRKVFLMFNTLSVVVCLHLFLDIPYTQDCLQLVPSQCILSFLSMTVVSHDLLAHCDSEQALCLLGEVLHLSFITVLITSRAGLLTVPQRNVVCLSHSGWHMSRYIRSINLSLLLSSSQRTGPLAGMGGSHIVGKTQ